MNALAAAWMVVGTALVLLVPGWTWSLAIFPGHRPLRAVRTGRHHLDVIERVALALVLSLVLVPFTAIVWNGLLRLPLGTFGSAAMLLVLTGGGLAWAKWGPTWLQAAKAEAADDAIEASDG